MQDPQADQQQHTRVMLAIVICMLAFWVYSTLFAPQPPPRQPGPAPETTGPSGASGITGGEEEATVEKDDPVVLPREREPVEPRQWTVQSGLFEMVWNNEGAVLEFLKLKRYFHSSEGKKEFDLLPAFPKAPDSIRVRTAKGEDPLANAVYQKGRGTLSLEVGSGPQTWPWEVMETEEGKVGFRTVTDEKVIAEKVVTLPTGEDYHFLIDITLQNSGEEEIRVGYYLRGALGITEEDVGYGKEPNDLVQVKEKGSPETFAMSKVAGGRPPYEPDFDFVGVQAKYFTCLLVPLPTPDMADQDLHTRLESVLDGDRLQQLLKDINVKPEDLAQKSAVNVAVSVGTAKMTLPPGGTLHHRYLFYAGPKEKETLESYNKVPSGVDPYTAPHFERILFTGITGPLSKFFVTILAILTKVTQNWGISIIILTLLVRAALHPLNRKAQKSLFGMSQLKPQMDAIRAKYKGKKSKETSAKMQREYMALYKEHGVNPLGGCLPIFLQFPVFIGLYWGINQAFELRQAPFFLWIDDLSRQDALFDLGFQIPLIGTSSFNLLPILVIITWILQQKMQPKPADPQMQQQQKMMSYMLIFMGFLFYTIPSGLNLYFVTSSTLGMLENRWIKKQLQAEADEAPPVVDPRKKKKRKKKGH